jgi:hypothetical protein
MVMLEAAASPPVASRRVTAPTPAQIAALAELAGHPLPRDRVGPAGEAVAAVIALAETLEDLPLEGVEPVLGPAPP